MGITKEIPLKMPIDLVFEYFYCIRLHSFQVVYWFYIVKQQSLENKNSPFVQLSSITLLSPVVGCKT